MLYPRLVINLKKLTDNLNAVAETTKEKGGCSLMIVTKGLCADFEMAKVVAEHPAVDFMADSRVKNIAKYSELAKKNNKQTVLLRLPMHCDIAQVIRYADISFNSEISTIRLLHEEAKSWGKKHKIVLMIDLGDLREGIFYQDEEKIFEMVAEILKLEYIELYGIGVNLTCYGAIIPKKENLAVLAELAKKIEERFNIELPMVSGGNSSSIYLIEKGELPAGINNLRLGEAFLLGNDTAYGTRLPGTVGDAIILEAQVVELQEKLSVPIGESGVDAFGQKPHYEDRGLMKRAILAIGRQDADIDNMRPFDAKAEILGASSDHLLLDVTNSDTDYKVGDILKFTLSYGGMLRAATSHYVERAYINLLR